MRKVLVEDIEKELTSLIQSGTEDIIYCIHEQPLVFKSKQAEINNEYCVNNNYQICNSFNMGGIIVANSGDMDIAIMKKEGWNVGENLLLVLKDKLQSKIPNLSIHSNDLLVDGKYKIISYASINANSRLIYTCVHISFNPDINAIENICTKPMNKIPKGLSEYGVTTEEVVKFLEDLLIN